MTYTTIAQINNESTFKVVVENWKTRLSEELDHGVNRGVNMVIEWCRDNEEYEDGHYIIVYHPTGITSRINICHLFQKGDRVKIVFLTHNSFENAPNVRTISVTGGHRLLVITGSDPISDKDVQIRSLP